MILELLLRWLHIFSAILLAGGVFYQRAVLLPGLSNLDAEQSDAIRQSLRKFWSRCVRASAVFLFVSGLINAVSAIKAYEFAGPYHVLVLVKLILALAILMLAELLAGKTSAAQKIRENESFWLNVQVMLIVAVVCCGGYMRSIERTPKPADEDSAVVVPKATQNSEAIAEISTPVERVLDSGHFGKQLTS